MPLLRHSRTLFILVLLCLTLKSSGQKEDRSREVVREFCPLSGSTPELTEIFTRFYVIGELNLKYELDSAFAAVTDISSALRSKADSASFFFCHGLYYSRSSKYDESRKYFTKAEYLFLLMDDKNGALYSQLHLGTLTYYIKQEEKAYAVFQELAREPDCDEYMKAKLHHNIGCLAMEIERPSWTSSDTAKKNPVDRFIIDHFDKAVAHHRITGNLSALAATYSVYVNELLSVGDPLGAKALADSTALLSQRSKDIDRLAFARIKQGMVLDTMGKPQEAIPYFDKAIQYYDSIGNYLQKIHALSWKMKAQKKLGYMTSALNTALDMYWARAEFFDSEMAEANQRYEVEHETKKKQLTIQKQEAELEKNKLEISNRNRLLIASGLGALALGAFFLLLLQRNKRKAREEKDALLIASKQEGIRAMIQAQEKERQRIAKDLHDGIVQQLGGLKLGLQKKLDENADQESARLINVLDESARELRDLSHRMMPRSLKELGLAPSLEDMLENSLGHSEIQYEFEHYGIESRFQESIEITLYRIAQELVNNVIKHSRASRVSVQLFKAAEDVVLIVEDNGRGLKKINNKGIGLLNITSRLDTVNGQVNFEPSPESGTLATIRIPLTDDTNHIVR